MSCEEDAEELPDIDLLMEQEVVVAPRRIPIQPGAKQLHLIPGYMNQSMSTDSDTELLVSLRCKI